MVRSEVEVFRFIVTWLKKARNCKETAVGIDPESTRTTNAVPSDVVAGLMRCIRVDGLALRDLLQLILLADECNLDDDIRDGDADGNQLTF